MADPFELIAEFDQELTIDREVWLESEAFLENKKAKFMLINAFQFAISAYIIEVPFKIWDDTTSQMIFDYDGTTLKTAGGYPLEVFLRFDANHRFLLKAAVEGLMEAEAEEQALAQTAQPTSTESASQVLSETEPPPAQD